jgi:ribose transport system substrate-binding protein
MTGSRPILGLGPHGERPAGPDRITLTAADRDRARRAGFTVAIVLHTRGSDHARQHLAGMVAALGRHAVSVVEVVDCAFDPAAQVRALDRLVKVAPDAIVSLPLSGADAADAHAAVPRAGIKLILIDNSPARLLPGSDYACLVSADNFGLGEIGARLLAPHVGQGATVGVISYKLDFFVAAQREIAFRRWMEARRPDIALATIKFAELGQLPAVLGAGLAEHPRLGGLFAVWDTPAIEAISTLRRSDRVLPVTTVDLGREVATALASGEIVKGIAAQQPYDQGVTVAKATVATLLGLDIPPWIALPAVEVTRGEVVSAYQAIWHQPAPPQLITLARRAGAALPARREA